MLQMKACNDKYLMKGLVVLNDLFILSTALLPPIFALKAHMVGYDYRYLALKHIKINNNY